MSDLEFFMESIPNQRGEFHQVHDGNVYVINFAPNQTALLAEHMAVIDRLVVPFLVRAVKHLGPGDYNLNVLGSASATGTKEHNEGLGFRRAYAAALHAISGFEIVQGMDPSLHEMNLHPNPGSIGSDKAATAVLGHPTRDQIERNQAFFRGAVFKFRAGIVHPDKANTYHIREIYLFKFQKISEPAPAFIKTIESLLGNAVIKEVVDKVFGQLIAPVMKALGNVGNVVSHMVSYVIPSTTDYCFEVKDYRDTHALYRFNGLEHKDSIGLKEILKLISGLHAMFKYAETALGKVMEVHKTIEKINKLTDDFVETIARGLEATTSKDFADTFRRMARKLKNDSVVNWVISPGSDWAPFQFFDQSPNHKVAALAGPAKRTSVDAAMRTAVHVDFGGYVANTWTDYKAHAQIISRFSLKRGIFGMGFSSGTFVLVKGPYGGDIAVGVGDVVTG